LLTGEKIDRLFSISKPDIIVWKWLMCSMIWVNDILENERMKMLFKNYTEGHKWNYSFVFISMSSTGKCMWNTDFDLKMVYIVFIEYHPGRKRNTDNVIRYDK
jgi:hypothetical protein